MSDEFRKEFPPEKSEAIDLDKSKFKQVNHSVTKVDGIGLATGKPAYVDDFTLPNMLYAKVHPSPHAHARILSIDTTKAESMPGVRCILVPPDPVGLTSEKEGEIVHRVNRVIHTTAGQGFPEPSPYDCVFLDHKVRLVGDKVCVIAAESEMEAANASRKIKVEYEVLDAVFCPEATMEPGAPKIHDQEDYKGFLGDNVDKNIACEMLAELPDAATIEEAFNECDFEVTGRFDLGYAQHCAIEPHSSISYLDMNERLIIRTATQVPWHCRRITAQVLEIPERRVRVIKPRMGGGFGSKQEVILEYIVGAVTLRTGRPCRLVMTRSEVFVFSRTRHPFIVKYRVGAKKDGTIHAIDMDAIENTGAFGSHSLTVLSCAGSKTLPLYNKTKGVRFHGRSVYTNMPTGGAYRGYGGTQGAFALEVLIDELAEKMGMDAIELRRKNHIKEGEGSPVFAALGEGKEGSPQILRSVKLDECIDVGIEKSGWNEKRGKKFRDGAKVKGIGMCALMQGSGIPDMDMGSAFIKMNEDGSFNLLVGATDLGTGSDTVFAQIAAEVLCVPHDMIIVTSSDTDMTPFDVGAYASSTTYITGNAVKRTAERMRVEILNIAAEMLTCEPQDLATEEGKVVSIDGKHELSYENICIRSLYSQNHRQPMAHGSNFSSESPPPFAAHFVEVEVDEETGVVKLLNYIACCDCGTAIHPRLAEGQVEGAVANGISFAMTEEYAWDESGRMLNGSFSDYKICSTRDMPPLESYLADSYEPTGPFGAKSVSEININGAAPAIANAIYDAVGVRMHAIPFTPEKVLAAIRAKNA
ncbi:MAG: molybdopterin-dependent oxidoreductase [Candidatus Lindowbacteria bacterium]|nr:molybdopterin-dependent oxidoreductase [Candidatus Lindowbacteria bacterium]